MFVAFKAEEKNPAIWDQVLSRGTNVPVEMSKAKYRRAIELEALKRGFQNNPIGKLVVVNLMAVAVVPLHKQPQKTFSIRP